MPNIDTLSIQFNANGTDKAVTNIKAMGYAVRNLAMAVKAVDSSKLGAFTSAMETVKKSIPTDAQVSRMTAFSAAISELSGVIGSANISGFSKDMSNLGEAVQTFKRSSVNSITNAVSAMQNLQSQTQATAKTISNAIPNSSVPIERGNRANESLSQAKELVATLDKVQVKASTTSRILEKMGLATPTKKFKDLESSAEKVRQKYDQVRAALQKGLNEGSIESGGTEYKKKMAELDALRNKYDELILKQRELAREGGAVQLNPTLSKSIDAFKSGFSQIGGVIKGGLVAGLRLANNHVKSFVTRIKSAGSALKNMVTGGNSASKMAKKFASELFRVSKMLKLMVTRMALRAVIKEVGNGFKSLALHSEEFNNSMSSLINGSKKLGYSFAAMVSPLINALAPAIVYVINLLTKLINVVQQVFGALTGASTWNKAKDFTESWADNIEAANKGAKELKKTVLGFDELNQLQEKTSGGGGNDIKDMFETMEIDPKWKEFADWLKDMWKMGDFTKLGEKLGKSLRALLESIPWDKIRKTAHKLGESLATLINGFVEVERLGYDIGYTIAQSVNTVFEFLNGFVHKLHWDSIGKFIADTFNGFFETIDWPLIKDTIVTGLAGVAEAIQNFIETFHWDNLSNFVINAVDTISSGIKAFVDGVDWLDLGKRIGDQINKAIEGINWHDVGDTLGAIIEAAVDYAYGLVTTFNVDSAVKAIEDFMSGVFERVNSERIGETLGTMLHKLIEVIKKFWQNEDNRAKIKEEIFGFFRGIANSMTADDFEFIFETALGAALLLGLKNAIGVALGGTTLFKIAITLAVAYEGFKLGSKLGQWITGDDKTYDTYTFPVVLEWTIGELPKSWDDFKSKLDDWIRGWDEMCQNAHWFVRILATIVEIANPVAAAVHHIWKAKDGIKDYGKETEEVNNKLRELADRAKDASTGTRSASESFKEAHTNTTNFKEAAEKAAASTKSASDYLAEGQRNTTNFKAAVEEATGQVNNLTTANDNAKGSFGRVASEMTTTTTNTYTASTSLGNLVTSMNTASQGAQDMSKKVSSSFGTIYSDSKKITVNVPNEVSGAQQKLSGTWQTLSKDTSTSMGEVKKSVDDSMKDVNKSLDTVKSGMTEKEWTFDGVASGLKKTFEDAKSGIKGVWNSIAEKLNGEHSIGEGKLKINLPTFATGGFPEDGLFLASHHELVGHFSNGKTAVANNDQIIAGIETGVYSAVSKAMAQNNGGSQYISNEIIVDGDVVARSITKAQNRQNMRYSPQTT